MRLLFSVPTPTKITLTHTGYRYFVDLRNGAFVYVFCKACPPPEDWPLVEINAKEVEELLNKEFE